jgi:hypothetical protein
MLLLAEVLNLHGVKEEKHILHTVQGSTGDWIGHILRFNYPLKHAISLLNTKRNLLYISNQSVPRCKHSTMVIKTNQLMMYKAKVAV